MEWECSSCWNINRSEEQECMACDSARPAAAAEASAATTEWQCWLCKLMNDSENRECFACETRRSASDFKREKEMKFRREKEMKEKKKKKKKRRKKRVAAAAAGASPSSADFDVSCLSIDLGGQTRIGSSNDGAAAGASPSSADFEVSCQTQSRSKPAADLTRPSALSVANAPDPESERTVVKVWHCSTCELYTLSEGCDECGAAARRPSDTGNQHDAARKQKLHSKSTVSARQRRGKLISKGSRRHGKGGGSSSANGEERVAVSIAAKEQTTTALPPSASTVVLGGQSQLSSVAESEGSDGLAPAGAFGTGNQQQQQQQQRPEHNNLDSSAEKLLSKRKRSAWEESSLSSPRQQQSVGRSRPAVLPVIDITNVCGIPRKDEEGRMVVLPGNTAAPSVLAAAPMALENNSAARSDDNTNPGTSTSTTARTSPTKLSLLHTLAKERKERAAEMARYEELYQSLTQGLDSTLAENATLRRMLSDRDEEQLRFETTLAINGDALRARSIDILRYRQDCLLGLYHARHCRIEAPATCPVDFCGRYKELLQHNNTCTTASCDFPHCRTHRALQQHSDRCRDDACLLCRPLREAIRREEEETAAAHAIASMRSDGAPVLGGIGRRHGGSSSAAMEKSLTVGKEQRQDQQQRPSQQMVSNNLQTHQANSGQDRAPTPPQPPSPSPRSPPSPMSIDKPPSFKKSQEEDREGQVQDQQMQHRQQVLAEKSPSPRPSSPIPTSTSSIARSNDRQQRHTETPVAEGTADMIPSPDQKRSTQPSTQTPFEKPQLPNASSGQEQEYEQQPEQRRPIQQFLLSLRNPAPSTATQDLENQHSQQNKTPATVGRTGTPPPLVHSKSTQRRTASPLSSIDQNMPAKTSVVRSNSRKPSISNPLRKQRQSFQGSVAASLLSQANRGRPDLDSLSSSNARFVRQLQSKDDASPEGDATSSIDTEDSVHLLDSTGVLACKSCTLTATSTHPCNECGTPNLDLLQHIENCETGFAGGCRSCRVITPLIRLHARQCVVDQCPVASCSSIKSCANCNGDAPAEKKTGGAVLKPSLCEVCQAILPSTLFHSANCTDIQCAVPQCTEMKGHIAHWMACSEGPDCCICRRHTAILRAHAIECQDSSCGIPSCSAAKASLFRPSLFRAPVPSTPPDSQEVWL